MTRHLQSDTTLPALPGPFVKKMTRRLYRTLRGKTWRHNAHLWPYTKVDRNADGSIRRLSVFGRAIPLISLREAFAGLGSDLHIVLSGPSVRQINYTALGPLPIMGVNGSIALQDQHDVGFPYYCVIDRSFARDQRDTMRRIVSGDRVLFLGVDVLRQIMEYIPLADLRCRLCIVEDLTERACAPSLDAAQLARLRAQGRDLKVFSEPEPLGFSFDPALGWFDADTVAYTALQIGVWGGARRIYFHGLDIKGAETTPRFYESGGARPSTRLEENFTALIEPAFRQAIPVLANRGVDVYNLSPVSALGTKIMPFVPWQSLTMSTAGES